MRWKHALLALGLYTASLADIDAKAASPAQILPKASTGIVTGMGWSCGGLYAVGERGHVFTVNQDPVQQPFPMRTFLTGLAVHGDQLWVVGHDALIAYLPDCGELWHLQHYKPELEAPLFALSFQNTKQGLAVGAYGLILFTENSGREWRRIFASEAYPHYYAVQYDASRNWYLAGEFGTVIKLSQQGELSVTYNTKTSVTFFGLEVLAEDRWLAYGLRGLLVSFDGTTATKIDTPRKFSLYGSTQYKDGYFLFGEGGTLYYYRDQKLVDLSLEERIPLICGVIDDNRSELILGSTNGFRHLPLRELNL